MSKFELGAEFRAEMDTLMQELTGALPQVIGSIDERIALPPDAVKGRCFIYRRDA